MQATYQTLGLGLMNSGIPSPDLPRKPLQPTWKGIHLTRCPSGRIRKKFVFQARKSAALWGTTSSLVCNKALESTISLSEACEGDSEINSSSSSSDPSPPDRLDRADLPESLCQHEVREKVLQEARMNGQLHHANDRTKVEAHDLDPCYFGLIQVSTFWN